MNYIKDARYKINNGREYFFVCPAPGMGVIHYIFRSYRGGWLESFTDLLIDLGEIEIKKCGR